MRTSDVLRRALLGITTLVLSAIGTAQADTVCYPEPRGTDVVYNDALQPYWYPWPYGSTADTQATTAGMLGSHVIRVQYTQAWGGFILSRAADDLWHTAGKRALLFRVKGVYDNDLKQIWVYLRGWDDAMLGSVAVADHMVTPPLVNMYDPNAWYTVVIPLDALNAENVFVKEIIFEGGQLANYGAGDLGTIYLDEIWWVEGLEFPLAGYTAYTAPISSVMDHTMDVPYAKDHVVTAYTGEEGAGVENEHEDDPTCIKGDGTPFDINGEYRGASTCGGNIYLSYDGHPGIDYAVADVPVYPVANGMVIPGRCWTYNAGGTCAGWGAVGVDHGNGYITQYWHMADIAVEAGTRVTTDTVLGVASDVGIPGAKHLHFEVALKSGAGYVHVDPYGWADNTRIDPHRAKAVSVPLWK